MCVSGGLRRLRVYRCRRVLWEYTRPPVFGYFFILQDLHIFGYFSKGSYCRSLLFAGGHTEPTRLLTGPGLITWALGCTFGTLLFV